MESVTRVAYELANGQVAPKAKVKSGCGNLACVRPEHLIAATKVIPESKIVLDERTEKILRRMTLLAVTSAGRRLSMWELRQAAEAEVDAMLKAEREQEQASRAAASRPGPSQELRRLLHRA